MPTTEPTFLTTYQGSIINRDGITFVWDGNRYNISTNISVSTQDSLNIVKKCAITFNMFLEPDTKIEQVEVLVNNNIWNDTYRNENKITLTFTETFLLNQQRITFRTDKYKTKSAFVIKARVFAENDVVIQEYLIDENMPILGQYTPPIFNTGASGGNVGSVSTAIGVTTNFEQQTTNVGQDSNFFNNNNQFVEATLSEVQGNIIQ